MKISICNKCKGFNYNKVIKIIKEKYKDCTIEIGCNNMCGIGRRKIVVFVNDIPIIADTYTDLLKKIEELIN